MVSHWVSGQLVRDHFYMSYFCLRPKAKDLGITWVVVLGFFVWSMLYQLPPAWHSHYFSPPPLSHNSLFLPLSLSLLPVSLSLLPVSLSLLPVSLPLSLTTPSPYLCLFTYAFSPMFILPASTFLLMSIYLPTSTYLYQHTYHVYLPLDVNLPSSTYLYQHTHLLMSINQQMPTYHHLLTYIKIPTYLCLPTNIYQSMSTYHHLPIYLFLSLNINIKSPQTRELVLVLLS